MTGLVPFNNVRAQNDFVRHQLISDFINILDVDTMIDGPHKKKLIATIKKRTGYQHVIPTHSGTIALQIIARYHHTGGEAPTVSLPAISFVATANAFLLEGWNVKFMDVDDFGNAIWYPHCSDLIVPVGLYGHPVDYSRFTNTGVTVVEDACQSWLKPPVEDGISWNNQTSVISFDPTKNVSALGNGGAILTNDSNLADFAEQYCNHGKRDGEFVGMGSNARMSELDCSVVNSKLFHIDNNQVLRKLLAIEYLGEFADLPIECLMRTDSLQQHACQKFVIRVEDRDSLAIFLKLKGVETKMHYGKALPDIPHLSRFKKPPTDNYKSFATSTLSLPFYERMPIEHSNHVIQSVREYFAK